MKRLSFLASLFGVTLAAQQRKPDGVGPTLKLSPSPHPGVLVTIDPSPYFRVYAPAGKLLAQIDEATPDMVKLIGGTMEETVLALANTLMVAQDRDRKHPECKNMGDWFKALKEDNEKFEREWRERREKDDAWLSKSSL